jgi:hypothetical protein
MKTADIIQILEDENTYALIEAALKEADRRAMENTSCKYSVVVFADKTVDIREKLAGDNSWMQNDPAIAEIGVTCYQYSDGVFENYPQKELIRDLIKECDLDEYEDYQGFLARYQQENRDFFEDMGEYEPEPYEIIDWFKDYYPNRKEEFYTPPYLRLEHFAINEVVDEAENDGRYSEIIDEYIKQLKAIAKEED